MRARPRVAKPCRYSHHRRRRHRRRWPIVQSEAPSEVKHVIRDSMALWLFTDMAIKEFHARRTTSQAMELILQIRMAVVDDSGRPTLFLFCQGWSLCLDNALICSVMAADEAVRVAICQDTTPCCFQSVCRHTGRERERERERARQQLYLDLAAAAVFVTNRSRRSVQRGL